MCVLSLLFDVQTSNGSAKKPRLEFEEHDDKDFQETLRLVDEEAAKQKPGNYITSSRNYICGSNWSE